ncbi:Protein transport protein sec20 [Conoideocrella luteorostrata]|uniref:Protein transport protein sec20 n=1 Tax=Conoideocrella luteorostrata TaxID=1105319 RepID=A0AAJ0CLP1_9HYPO|nr:Protein transport protein sec20 [Conoideocrella luteorostrata]
MSLEGLDERLTALQETTTQLRELIDRLATLDFQPGSVPQGTDEESSVSGELSAEIGQILRNGLDEQELLNEEVKYVRPEGAEKGRLKEGVERLGAELASCRGHFRKARLAARESLAQARKLERQLIIQSYSVPVSEPSIQAREVEPAPAPAHTYRSQRHSHQIQQQSSLSEEEQKTVGASNNVTNALRRTHDLIAAELFRSEYAHQTLTESSAALKQLNDSYSSLDTMLTSSRNLLGTLLRSQKSDTWYLQTALYMLIVTGVWLMFRRLLYGPMWWLVWLPLRILFGVGTKAGSAVMQRSVPGGSEKVGVGVGKDGKVSVDGLPNADLPTAQVGQKETSEWDPDSMVEKVGKIVDAAKEADELGNVGDQADVEPEDQPRNPKKRMWEEPEVGGETQQRDEL